MTGDFLLGLTVGVVIGLVAGFVILLFESRRPETDDNFRGDQWP